MNKDKVEEVKKILEDFGNEIRVIIDEANEQKTQMILVIAKCSKALDRTLVEIIQLFPDEPKTASIIRAEKDAECQAKIEEAVRVERERILGQMALERCDPDVMSYFEDYYWLPKDVWKALKSGGKTSSNQ